MAKKNYFTNDEMLQNAKVLFETLENNSSIAQKLDEYGYGAKEITQGKALYAQAETLYGKNKKETDEEKVAYAQFKQKMDDLTQVYSEHRNKSKLVYKTNDAAQISLGLKTAMSRTILPLLEEIAYFYKNLNEQEALRSPLERVKITQADITSQQSKVTEAKNLYAIYSQEKNESEQATKDKNVAFEALDKWTKELYSYAKYALADQPQFLQIFGKAVS